MKKEFALFVVLVVLPVVAWLAATFYVGLRVEQVVRDEVAKMEILPGEDDVLLDVVRYERGLFSSTAHTCLIIQGELAAMPEAAALSGQVCSLSTIHHGPLAFTDEGLRVGLASTREVLDLSALPAEGKGLIEQLFQGKAPVVGHTFYGFDGSVRIRVAFSPVNLDSPMGTVALDQLQLDVHRPDIQGYPVNSFVTLKGLDINAPQGQVAIESLTGSVDVVAMLGGTLPLTDVNLNGEGLRYAQHDLSLLEFDFTLQGSSQNKGDTLAGKSGLWLESVAGAMVPLLMDSAYLGVEYGGLDKQALIKVNALNNELDQLQTNLLLGAMANNEPADPQETVDRIKTLIDEMMTVIGEQLLHPGESQLAMTLLVDNADERQLSLDARTRYLGIEGRNLPLQELQALTEQQMNQMLDIALQVEMHEAIIPPPLAMQLPGLASQGVVVQDGSRWRSVLNASGDDVVLNGETISVAVLKQRLEAAAGPMVDVTLPNGEGDVQVAPQKEGRPAEKGFVAH